MTRRFLQSGAQISAIALLGFAAIHTISSASIPSEFYDEYDADYGDVRHEYSVSPGEIYDRIYSNDFETLVDQNIIRTIKTALPQAISDQYLRSIILTENIDGEAFAGEMNDEGHWEIVIDIRSHEGDMKELQKTAIHEVAHILSLNSSQLQANKFADCNTLELDEGCLNTGSYLYPFYNAFWNGQFKQHAFFSQYEKAPSAFVSEYASTNLAEDFADTFAEFVERDKPRGRTIAEQKILYMYNFPELVEIRNALRNSNVA